jgi:hypothetical protein
VYEAPITAPDDEPNRPRSFREQCVVTASADVYARMELRPALTNNDATGFHKRTAGYLHTKHLGL